MQVLDVISSIGKTVTLKGWVNTRRDHGKIVFFDLRDRTSLVQMVVSPELAGDINSEYVIEVEGLVKERPEKLINTKLPTGGVEVEVKSLKVISKSAELPFDIRQETLDLQLPTLLDYRSLTLRHPKIKTVFEIQAQIAESFRQAARTIGCTEIFPPTVSASSTEGGAEVLPVNYFGYPAFMVQSPQLYKQMLAGVFEKVFLISHIYRTEPSVTTRHLVESIQLDCEIGFIESFDDLCSNLEYVFSQTIKLTQEKCAKQMEFLGVPLSKVSAKVPRLTMREAQELIFKRTKVDHRQESDLMPEDERELCRWALEQHDSDLVTITHFPTKKRAFYSMPDPANPEYSLSYDLLYKGLEISSGAQRIHNYDQLIETIKSRGMDPKNFEMYLQAFKYGMPEHGGFSYGLERTTMKLLDLANIREASLYPRDVERVDFRLSELFPKEK